jgi:hypothetical protein
MNIYNYNPERAELALQQNNKRVKSDCAFFRTAHILQTALLVIMSAGVIGMLACTVIVASLNEGTTSLLLSLVMAIGTLGFGLIVVILMLNHHRRENPSDDAFDDIETKYHRLLKTYKSVRVELMPDNTILCICEDDQRVEECKELKPRHIKMAHKLTQPTLDLSTSCLWLPSVATHAE